MYKTGVAKFFSIKKYREYIFFLRGTIKIRATIVDSVGHWDLLGRGF